MTLGKKIALIAAGAAILGAGTLAAAPKASADGLTIVLPLGGNGGHDDHDRYYHRDFRRDDHRYYDRHFDDHHFGDRRDGDRYNGDRYNGDRHDDNQGYRGHDDNGYRH